MTPEAQRIAIAEACGWRHEPRFNGDVAGYYVRGDERIISEETPNYLNDLNAMHEAENALLSIKSGFYTRAYFFELVKVVAGINTYERGWDGDARVCCEVLHATASQRAEAFLRTLGKWEDDK